MQWTKKLAGALYTSGNYRIDRMSSTRWVATIPRPKDDNRPPYREHHKTLTSAKQACENNAQAVANKLAQEAITKSKQAQEATDLAAKIERARAMPEYDASCGLAWYQWAELRIGCTLEQLRKMEVAQRERARVGRLLDQLANIETWSEHQDTLKDTIAQLMTHVKDNDYALQLCEDTGVEVVRKQEAIDLERQVQDLKDQIDDLLSDMETHASQ